VATIRDLKPEDLTALGMLLGELGYPVAADELPGRLARFLSGADNRVLVMESEASGAVLAFAALEITHPVHHPNPVAHLSSFAVASSARRQGLGRRLLAAVEEAARQRGCGLLVLTSGNHRAEAHVFYPAAGYAQTGHKFTKPLHAAGTSRPERSP
jgi:GNAT superfamily N-acetyltransferase